jgi:hypothetical protein
MTNTVKTFIAAMLALSGSMAAYAVDAPTGTPTYKRVLSTGNAVSELQSGHKYLIYDGNNSQGTAFRYADPTNEKPIQGTVVANPESATLEFDTEYVWEAIKTDGAETWQFKSEKYGTYMSYSNSTISTGNNELTLQAAESSMPFTVTFSGTTAKVNYDIAYWDGGADNRLVGWGSSTGHPYYFYEVIEDQNRVDCYCYRNQTVVGDKSHTASTSHYIATTAALPTVEHFTASLSSDDNGLLFVYTPNSDLEHVECTIKSIKTPVKYIIAEDSSSSLKLEADGTGDNAKFWFYILGDSGKSFLMYSPATGTFVSSIGSNSGTAIGLGDAPEARTLQLVVNSDHTESICDAAYGDSSYYFNYRDTLVGTWSNDNGSHWYTIASEDQLTANTGEGVISAFDEAIASAQAAHDALTATNVDATELKELIDQANSARIGHTDFATLTTSLNEKSASLLEANPTSALYAAVQTANGIYIAHDVPGYLPVSTTENTALKTAIDAANAVCAKDSPTSDEVSEANSNLTSAVNALTAKIAEQSAAQTTIYTTGYYRISNKNGRGTLYYNSGNSNFIWSTGKNAFSGSEDADEMLWGFIEKDGVYYLYNVASKKFANLGIGTYGYLDDSWALTDILPVGITLNSSSAGYPYVEILGGNTHMSVSNDYNGPIISYYASSDGGVPMVFEYVKDADSDVAAAMLDKITTDKIAAYYISQVESFTAGDEIGKFSQTALSTAKSALETVKSNTSATKADADAAYNDFLATFNKPEVGKVYTIESYHSTGDSRRHLYNNEGTLKVSASEDEYGQKNYQYWLFEENGDTYSFSNTIGETQTKVAARGGSGTLIIERDPNVYGCVNLRDTGSSYVVVLHTANNNGDIDRAGNPTLSNASGQFYITLAENANSTTVGISEITVGNGAVEQNVIYDLQGRRVMHPTRSGLYIVNGTKKLITL